LRGSIKGSFPIGGEAFGQVSVCLACWEAGIGHAKKIKSLLSNSRSRRVDPTGRIEKFMPVEIVSGYLLLKDELTETPNFTKIQIAQKVRTSNVVSLDIDGEFAPDIDSIFK
jgi:hypothetical protein